MSTVVPRNMIDYKKPAEALFGVAEPAISMMKFPHETTLPSIPELEAKFVCFGSLHAFATSILELFNMSSCVQRQA